jgi:hypothetical protein
VKRCFGHVDTTAVDFLAVGVGPMTSMVIRSRQKINNIRSFGFGTCQNPNKRPNCGQINNIWQSWAFGVVPKLFIMNRYY